MSVLINIWLKTEQLEKLAAGLKKKGEKGISATIAVNDEVNEYGQNAVAYIAPSKEDKEKGKKPFYFGNGKAVWHDGKLVTVKYDAGKDVAYEYAITGGAANEAPAAEAPAAQVAPPEDDDLPF